MKKVDYFLFSTDADNKCRHLSDADFREVFCAVFSCLRDGVEPEFDNYLLYDYYEKVLSTPYFFLSTYDPSRRRKKKTDEIIENLENHSLKAIRNWFSYDMVNAQRNKIKNLIIEL